MGLAACAALIEDGGRCLPASIDLTTEDAGGVIELWDNRVFAPESIRFDVIAGNCGLDEVLVIRLNDVVLTSFVLDPQHDCVCPGKTQTVTFTDSALLEAIWKPEGGNVFRLTRTERFNSPSTRVVTVQATLLRGSLARTECLFDPYDRECTEPGPCVSGGFDHVTEVREPFGDGILVSSTPYSGSVLPGSIDLSTLPDGDSTICISNDRSRVLYGSSSDGKLFTIDTKTGAGTLIGHLPFTSTAGIERDPTTGRSFVHSRVLEMHEFDIHDGSGIGDPIPTDGVIVGMEYVGPTLYVTGAFIPPPSPFRQLRILDPFSGTSTLVGITKQVDIGGLAHDHRTDRLYGIESRILVSSIPSSNLLIIDRATGQTTTVGDTGMLASGLQFGSDGRLYTTGPFSFITSGLYRVDPIDATVTLVGPIGFKNVTGLMLVEGVPSTNCFDFTKQGEEVMVINSMCADAGMGGTHECTSPAGATVTLEASGTSNGTVEWFEGFGTPGQRLLGTGSPFQATLPLGPHDITLRVSNDAGVVDLDDVRVDVVDTQPPSLGLTLSPMTLWPPNHRMVTVTAEPLATDLCTGASVALVSVASDEPDDSPEDGDGSTVNDIQGHSLGVADTDLLLRAERAGGGDGRIYTVTYEATDASGNSMAAASIVTVPHDQGGSAEPLMLDLSQNGSGTLVTWTEVPGAYRYNVVRGEVKRLNEDEDYFTTGPLACVSAATGQTSTAGAEDPAVPPPGQAFFYLVEYFDGQWSALGTADAAKEMRAPAGQSGCPH